MPTPNEIRDLVEQDRFELIMRCPFYGRIICSVELVVVCDPQVRLACTDYRHIFISGNAYSALPEEKRLAVLAHEVLHIALRHAFRVGDRDKNRFEEAADIEATFILTENFPDPYGIECPNNWAELTAEQIYELLPPRKNKTKAKSDHCSPNDTSDDNQQSEDEDKKKKNKSSKKKSGKNSPGDNSGDGDGDGSGSGDGDGDGSGSGDGDGDGEGRGSGDGDGDGSGSCDGCSSGNKQDEFSDFRPQFDSETEMNCIALSKNTLMDVRNRSRGTAPSRLGLLIEELDKPHVVWQVLLRQFIRLCRGGTYSWMRPNRRFISRGLYLPGRQNKSFSGIVGLDTSGSTKGVLPEFIAELTGLLKAFGKFDLTIIECDARIQQIWTVSSNEPMPDLKKHIYMGGGGTDFNPVFEYIRNNQLTPNVLIFFTDGYAECPKEKPPYPVLWMLTNGGAVPAPWGQAIYYEEN